MSRECGNGPIGLRKGEALRCIAGNARLVLGIDERQRVRLAGQNPLEEGVKGGRCAGLIHQVSRLSNPFPFTSPVYLSRLLDSFTWPVHLARSLGPFTWPVHLARSFGPCVRLLPPALRQVADQRGLPWAFYPIPSGDPLVAEVKHRNSVEAGHQGAVERAHRRDERGVVAGTEQC